MKKDTRWIKIGTVIVFVILFLVINAIGHYQVLRRQNEEQLKASYTAETTMRRMEAQLNRYLAKTDLLKRIIEKDKKISDDQFNILAGFLMADNTDIRAVELAKDGIVSQLYPKTGNEQAMGLDFFTHPERKESARIAKESGNYTLAGPFQLKQGGLGALLIVPIYTGLDSTSSSVGKKFWGFSMVVIDWNKFLDGLELDKLEKASYRYRIWKVEPETEKVITVAESGEVVPEDKLELEYEVYSDTWHCDIAPVGGWYSQAQLSFNSIIATVVSLLIAVIFWQFSMRRRRSYEYARRIEKSASEARAANAAKTSFLSRMSHDIRTPLNGIIGLIQIDQKHPDDRQLLDVNRQKILVAANHLLSLINDVLQMSKLENGEIMLAHEIVDLKTLSIDIMTIIEQRAVDAGVHMIYNENSDIMEKRYVYGSPLHLRQIFLNIYGNSIKYNRKGGRVESSFHIQEQADDRVVYQWIIEDNGIGMSQEFLQHIFEPFAQEHSDARSVYSGTGLGMAIVKTLIDKMEGTIEVESEEKLGTRFTITLPFEVVKEEEMQVQMEKTEPQEQDISGLHFLLAEDNELNAEIAQVLLEDEGAQVTIVQNGKLALECFQENPAHTFDAILMDIMMPVMDGIAATKAIRALSRPDAAEIPIIAMTANAFDEDAQISLKAGMNAHIPKPIQMEKVLEVIAKCCKD